MTPKEKADELIYQFAQRIPPSSYVAYEGGVQINFDLENSKNCALVAVDELIKYIGSSYWYKVKRHLENL
jgi:hypothetical protein